MAVAVVQKKQTAGAASHGTITITAATKDNWIFAFISQTASASAPGGKDATSGETGWTAQEAAGEHAVFGSGLNSLWLVKKRAVGGETELNPKPGTGGTIQGISYIEVEGLGATPTIETVVKLDNQVAVKTVTSPAVTTADSTDLIFAGVGVPAVATGTVEAWSASAGAAPTNVETLTTRCIGGYLVPGVALAAVTFTAKWTNSMNTGMLVFAVKPEAAGKVEGKASGTLLLTGAAVGTAANVVSGKATGPLLLTGTAKGTTANVVVGKGVGALLLTGTAKGTVANRVTAKASGVLLLTGTATGTVGAVVAGKASGRLVLGGTATGSSRAAVLGLAHGTLILTGAATATVGGAVVVSHPGMVSPSSRAGRSSPMSVAGLVKPRPGHFVAGLRPKPGLYPKVGLWPKGDTIVPD